MKTLRFEFPVLAQSDAPEFLDLVTEVPGVVAAVVSGTALEVVVSSSECAPLVRHEIVGALAAAGAVTA